MAVGDFVTNGNFTVQIDNAVPEVLTSVSALKEEWDMIEQKVVSAQGIPSIVKMRGAKKAGEVTIVRGTTQQPAFTAWIAMVKAGNMSGARTNLTVCLNNTENKPVLMWTLRNCVIASNEHSGSEAGGSSANTQTVIIHYTDIEEVPAGSV